MQCKEHPIIFSTDSVRAILEGRKTQTRRVINPQPLGIGEIQLSSDGLWRLGIGGRYNLPRIDFSQKPWRCPYGQVGDRLWVKETWCAGCIKEPKPFVCYKAGTNPELWPPCQESIIKSSLFMPRKFSRINLEITGLRVERLQEITEEDCLAEGITVMKGTWQSKKWNDKTRRLELTGEQHPYTGQYHFEVLWDEINAKRGYGWEVNPWVWAIEFKRQNSLSISQSFVSQFPSKKEGKDYENYGGGESVHC